MLQIEVDMFSGRPNPTWMITDEDATRRLLGMAREAPRAVTKAGSGYDGLGFREVRISSPMDDAWPAGERQLPFALGSPSAGDARLSGDLARRIVEEMPIRSDVRLLQHELTPLDARLRDVALEWMAETARLDVGARPLDPPPPEPYPAPPKGGNPLITTTPDAACKQCQYEVSQYNPGFWNNPATQPYNNCYNYARNWRTNTFAQPGRAHGKQTSKMACDTVTAAAMADGLKKRCDCLPAGEFPRRLMALVIAPGWDYHWYRHQRGGFWGHKPGQTAARNYDSNNKIITDPQTCARRPYTNFCGYLYAGKSVLIN